MGRVMFQKVARTIRLVTLLGKVVEKVRYAKKTTLGQISLGLVSSTKNVDNSYKQIVVPVLYQKKSPAGISTRGLLLSSGERGIIS